DGKRLVSTSRDGSVTVWDAVEGQKVVALQGHTNEVYGTAFSPDPDGWRLASAGPAGTARGRDARPLSQGPAPEPAGLRLLRFRCARPRPRAEVLDYVRTSAAVTPAVRELALSLAERYREESNPERLRQAAWDVVGRPHLNAVQYRFALAQAQTAHRAASGDP